MILAGNGGFDSIQVGETPVSGTDVIVSKRFMTVAVGKGQDSITELSLAVSHDETIVAGSRRAR